MCESEEGKVTQMRSGSRKELPEEQTGAQDWRQEGFCNASKGPEAASDFLKPRAGSKMVGGGGGARNEG